MENLAFAGSRTLSPARARERLDYIDALRGFACLWVLLHHSFESVPATASLNVFPINILAGIARIGWLGVSLFLVLSGFCLYYPLVRRAAPSEARLNLRKFAVRRALRIMPPYLAAVALFTGVAWWAARSGIAWPEMARVRDLATHVLMLHNLFPSTIVSINPSFWSLALEAQLYLAFPVLVWIAARRGLKGLLSVTFVVAVLWQGVVWLRHGISMEWHAQLAVAYHALPARCFEFACGMAAAALVARSEPRPVRPAALVAALLLGPALGFVLLAGRFGPLCDQAWGLIFGSAVVLLASVPHHVMSGWSLRWLTLLGSVSYSVYLVHQPIVDVLNPDHFKINPGGPTTLLAFIFVRIAVAVGFGIAFYHLLEKPSLARAAKSANDPAPIVPASQTPLSGAAS